MVFVNLMKYLILLSITTIFCAACEQKIETPAQPGDKTIEKNTTVVEPPAEKTVEKNTTIINPAPKIEDKTTTTTINSGQK